jgi:two-component system alkaline phosphatase synthesis response regulator PhoP
MSKPLTPKKRILLVDDDLAIRVLYTRVLAAAGFEVQTAHHGREGLELIPDFQPDLIILDLVMPEQEGIETILKLQQGNYALPILAISGAVGADEYLKVAGLLGARCALAKPITPEELLHAVRSLLVHQTEPA